MLNSKCLSACAFASSLILALHVAAAPLPRAGWGVFVLDTGNDIKSHTRAEEAINSGTVGGEPLIYQSNATDVYDVINLAGGSGTFDDDFSYPNGIFDESMEDFIVQATTTATIPAGTWAIGFGSDDGGQVTIPGIVFEETLNSTSSQLDQIRFEGSRAHDWTVGVFRLDQPLTTTITASMHDHTGTDSFEVAILDDEDLVSADPQFGWKLLGDGVFGWSLSTDATAAWHVGGKGAVNPQELRGVRQSDQFDIVSDLSGNLAHEFDVSISGNDKYFMNNKDPSIFTTTVHTDGATFLINPLDDIADGTTLDIIDASQITGSPTIVATDGGNWSFNPNTGEITKGGSQTIALRAGDADRDLDFDQFDLVRVQIAAKYLSGTQTTWGEGDWNGAPGGSQTEPPAGDGRFDQRDVIAALRARTYLTGPYSAINTDGLVDDDQISIGYDARTGEVWVDVGTDSQLTSIDIDSATSIFTAEPAQNLGGSFDIDADSNIFKATFGATFGSTTFGNVAQSGLAEGFLLGDLTIAGSLAGGGGLGDVILIHVPEPSSLLILGLALTLLLVFKWNAAVLCDESN